MNTAIGSKSLEPVEISSGNEWERMRVQVIKRSGADGGSERSRCRVAAYCRVSTGRGSQDMSIEGQAIHYAEVIGAHPEWELAGIYVERGRSATGLEGRRALAQLVRDATEGKVDMILTKSISRFARNTVDCLSIVRRLVALNVRIVFEKEGIDTARMESELMLSIMAAMAEEESRSISQNVRWGIKRRYEDGSYRQAVLPYGYCRDSEWPGEILVVPEEAKVVRSVFGMAAGGKRPGEMARLLNARGIRTRRGKKWSDAAIRYMLLNPFYTGVLVMRKYYRDDYVLMRNMGELPQYEIKHHHPAIVSREVYEEARRVLGTGALSM